MFEQIVFRLEPNESTFRPLNGSRPDESIRSALDYGDLSETFACVFGQSSWNGTSSYCPSVRKNDKDFILETCSAGYRGEVGSGWVTLAAARWLASHYLRQPLKHLPAHIFVHDAFPHEFPDEFVQHGLPARRRMGRIFPLIDPRFHAALPAQFA